MSRSIYVLAAALAVKDATGSFPDEADMAFAIAEPPGSAMGAVRLFVGEAKAVAMAAAVTAWADRIRGWSPAELDAAIPEALAAYDAAASAN
jgi:hypothetical protein